MSVCLFHCFSLPDSPFLCYFNVTSYFLILGTKSHYHVKKIHRQCDPFLPLNSPSRGFNSISGNTSLPSRTEGSTRKVACFISFT